MPDTATEPMDRKELQPCALCGEGIMHGGDIVFYELTVRSCIVDLESVRQQHGLEVMLGPNAAPLGAVFAPSTNVAHRMPASRHLLCANCAMKREPVLRFIGEESDASEMEG